MKKIQFSIILLILSFVSVCVGQSNNIYPKLILNDNYSQIQKKTSKATPLNYQIKPSKGLILDCSKYNFSLIKKMNGGKKPDLIHIVCKGGTYTIKLNVKGQTIIDASTMQSLDDPKKRFIGFQKDDIPMLAIGTIKITNGQLEMMTYWLAMINVN